MKLSLILFTITQLVIAQQPCDELLATSPFEKGTLFLYTRVVEGTTFYRIHKNVTGDDLIRIDSAAARYSTKNYLGASEILKNLFEKYPADPYIINDYARSLYWIHSQSTQELCLSLYKNLVDLLEEDGFKEAVSSGEDSLQKKLFVCTNTSFSEAYWKLGTLYLDTQMYKDAAIYLRQFELYSKSISSENADKRLMDQLYSFLTETYFFLNDTQSNRYYYCITKQNNPKNTYVERFKL